MTSYDDVSKHTPMMQQWASIKKQHPSALLLFRMGDFYEMFFEDAQRVAKLLDVTLTYRGESGGQRIPMAGVPYHAIEQYLARLVRLGVACVLAEQFGEPGKGLLVRKVTRVITPGTVTESEWIGEKDDSFVAAAYPVEDKGWAVGWLNLSSGTFRVWTEIADLADALQRIQPTEVVYPSNCADAFLSEDPRCRAVDSTWFAKGFGANILGQAFQGATPSALGWTDAHAALYPVGALLQYVMETQNVIPSHLGWPSLESPERFISIDGSTRKNLELVYGLQGGVAKTLWGALDDCSTSAGSRMLKRWICSPENSQHEAQTRLDAVESLQNCPDTTWLDSLKWCGDTERVVARLGLQTAKPKDLVALRTALAQLDTLRVGLSMHGAGVQRLESLSRMLEAPDDIGQLLTSYLMVDPRTQLRDGGVIADGVDTELDECRALTVNVDGVLRTMEQQERDATGITTLRIEYNRNSGYAIEVTKSHIDKVPMHYQRKQTLKNVERYTTAALRDFENKALTAADRALKREKALYEELLRKMQPHVTWLVSMSQALSQLDVLFCFARQATQWKYVRPVFDENPQVTIIDGRHPVVERHAKTFVANTVALGASHRTYVITGPNMGGKSTFMRQTALIALMAYMGCPVPAKSVVLGPMDAICTRIGASDDVASGRSTFMVEMQEAASIVDAATPRTLAILDEIGRGTSSLEGSALAQAVLERLHTGNRSMVMFATHYREVAQSLQSVPNMSFVRAQTDDQPGEIIFTHRMVAGIADSSYGIHVAMMAGLPNDVIARAHNLVEEQRAAHVSDASSTPWQMLATLDLSEYSPKELWAYLHELQNTGKNQ